MAAAAEPLLMTGFEPAASLAALATVVRRVSRVALAADWYSYPREDNRN
jgi:hypothetical protein